MEICSGSLWQQEWKCCLAASVLTKIGLIGKDSSRFILVSKKTKNVVKPRFGINSH
jgi:hypothetical protein